ncbi:peptidoglycan recognition protein family protein [Novosphingobium rhizosphaerae]|uniref:peptidoglycan recognition protein family protein n=1 Tax=Novosphingobium rhizosphaerae TaxID=1551649 RepID=UPI003D812AC3
MVLPIYNLIWMPAVLEAAGLKVAETPGWRSRGRAEMGTVRGVMCHHTATAAPGNMPTLKTLINGRSDLPGPLAQLGLGRDGTFYVIAAGRANHAGAGYWEGIKYGNSSFIGIEAENSGLANDPWPDIQMDAYHRGVAALLAHIGADAGKCCGHKEYALPKGRKPDPSFDMPTFRSSVAAFLSGKTPEPPIPAKDEQDRPTLRRGDSGALVAALQRALEIDDDGKFGPGTEKAVRAAQRKAGLVPDGIVGPKSWAALNPPLTASTSALASAPASGPAPQAQTVAMAALPVAGAASLPIADDANHPVVVRGGIAFGPGGQRFASRLSQGFYTLGLRPPPPGWGGHRRQACLVPLLALLPQHARTKADSKP